MNLGIKSQFKNHNIRPKKFLGQNFVVDENIIDKIVKTANLKKNDIVLEVGPGTGALTFELAKKVKKVIAVEKDDNLFAELQKIVKKQCIENIEIINDDILKTTPLQLKYKLIANIPYYITQPIIRKFLEAKNPPSEIILLIQKEVAQRICVRAPRMNLLAVSVQFYAHPQIISNVPKTAFWPVPEVNSAIIKITPNNDNENKISPEQFFKTVRAGFAFPRKMLIGNLSKKLDVPKEKLNEIFQNLNIDQKARAENLIVSKWMELAKELM